LSKGSNRRREDTQKIRDNWDAIFGKKDPKEQKPQQPSKENANSLLRWTKQWLKSNSC